MVDIIIKKGKPRGRSRSETEKELMKEWRSAGLDEGQIDQCAFLEREAKKQLGADKSFFKQSQIAEVDK